MVTRCPGVVLDEVGREDAGTLKRDQPRRVEEETLNRRSFYQGMLFSGMEYRRQPTCFMGRPSIVCSFQVAFVQGGNDSPFSCVSLSRSARGHRFSRPLWRLPATGDGPSIWHAAMEGYETKIPNFWLCGTRQRVLARALLSECQYVALQGKAYGSGSG